LKTFERIPPDFPENPLTSSIKISSGDDDETPNTAETKLEELDLEDLHRLETTIPGVGMQIKSKFTGFFSHLSPLLQRLRGLFAPIVKRKKLLVGVVFVTGLAYAGFRLGGHLGLSNPDLSSATSLVETVSGYIAGIPRRFWETNVSESLPPGSELAAPSFPLPPPPVISKDPITGGIPKMLPTSRRKAAKQITKRSVHPKASKRRILRRKPKRH